HRRRADRHRRTYRRRQAHARELDLPLLRADVRTGIGRRCRGWRGRPGGGDNVALCIVLQNGQAFSGSIMENIRFGRLEATDADVIDAAKLAGPHDFVMEMENQYRTEVGEGGSRLSAGQKQLVSFARAILADPQILVMDEATSSVDTETERRIQRGLGHVLAGRIAFVIGHRLSTIRKATRIIVVEGGRITESGTHAELMAARGHYYDLYRQQSMQEATKALDT